MDADKNGVSCNEVDFCIAVPNSSRKDVLWVT